MKIIIETEEDYGFLFALAEKIESEVIRKELVNMDYFTAIQEAIWTWEDNNE